MTAIRTRSPSRTRSADLFARYAIASHAYLRPVLLEGRPAYAVHAADGTCLWLESDPKAAGDRLNGEGMSLVSLQ
ncbi:hypothetical protein [Azospirillum sp. SYSU D00513]|uniref:hypothetical protein n=1 Tax=Azospirillum sp. SYSU D00513 TaxID=2812561 RepID=UPI001A9581EC|nr:hypothetical protein [Azospirillum sp. SYSU D00513]